MMPPRYTFDYAALSIGDARDMIQASAAGDSLAVLSVVSHCYTGDMYKLPMSELRNLLQQFVAGLKVYTTSLEDADVSDAIRLLKGMFGEGQPDA
jgi:hypothetical protein